MMNRWLKSENCDCGRREKYTYMYNQPRYNQWERSGSHTCTGTQVLTTYAFQYARWSGARPHESGILLFSSLSTYDRHFWQCLPPPLFHFSSSNFAVCFPSMFASFNRRFNKVSQSIQNFVVSFCCFFGGIQK